MNRSESNGSHTGGQRNDKLDMYMVVVRVQLQRKDWKSRILYILLQDISVGRMVAKYPFDQVFLILYRKLK